jgi:putative ABC transport system permease protein
VARPTRRWRWPARCWRPAPTRRGATGSAVRLRVLGLDALAVAAARAGPDAAVPRRRRPLALFAPAPCSSTRRARQLLRRPRLRLQAGLQLRELCTVAGSVTAGGGPLAVMDIAAAQDLFGRGGQLTRIDVRLRPAPTTRPGCARCNCRPACRPPSRATPASASQPLARLPRQPHRAGAGGAVHRRLPGVLGAVAQRRAARAAVRAARRAGPHRRASACGWCWPNRRCSAWSAALASRSARCWRRWRCAAGRRPGRRLLRRRAPHLQWSTPAALGYGVLGVVAAMVGGWCRRARPRACRWRRRSRAWAPPPARRRAWLGWRCCAPAACWPCCRRSRHAAGRLPRGGPAAGRRHHRAAGGCGRRCSTTGSRRCVAHRLLPLLAVERARRVRESAAVAVSGVVAALSLAVALTVMVASFRESVTRWLDVLLPADLYVRTAQQHRRAGDTAFLDAGAGACRLAACPAWRAWARSACAAAAGSGRPPVALLARPSATRRAPAAGGRGPAGAAGQVRCTSARRWSTCTARGRAAASRRWTQPFALARRGRQLLRGRRLARLRAPDRRHAARPARLPAPHRRPRVNDLQVWLAPGADAPRRAGGRARAGQRGSDGGDLVEFASAARDARAVSLRIFDRSFAVTYWLQAVAIAIGLFGVAASFSAQVLARRKEFGLLAHLGLTRGRSWPWWPAKARPGR